MWEIGTLAYELLFKKCPYEKDILEMMKGQRKLEDLSELRFPSVIPASEEAKDFIRKALEKNPSKRLSLDESLCHPFLNQSYKEMSNIKVIH
jgi:serine/threonine protein kinase